MKKLLLFIVVSSILFISCSKDQKTVEQKEDVSQSRFISMVYPKSPTIDYSTPDNLIKSYWEFVSWRDTTYKQDTTAFKFLSNSLKAYLYKERLKSMDEYRKIDYNLQYKIDKVEIQSESRAIVYTKQIAYPSAEKLNNYKYILSKVNNKWLIDEYLSECFMCKGTGKVYGETCTYCKGLGYEPIIWF